MLPITTQPTPVAGPILARLKNQNAPKPKANPLLKLSTLLVCDDPQLLKTLNRALAHFDVDTTVATDVDKAQESVLNLKFDSVIVDFKNLDMGCEVLTAARDTKLNGKTMLVAIVDDFARHRAAFDLGANFTIPRMATVDQAMRCLRSSYYMMLRKRRVSMRFPLDLPASGRLNNGSIEFRIVNLSETGMGIESGSGLAKGDIFSAMFELPGTDKSVKASARVIWKDQHGVGGAAFLQFEGDAEVNLQDWINGNLMGRYHL